MKKAFILIIVSLIILLTTFRIFHDEQKQYEMTLKWIEDKRVLCESAGFIFEQNGELENPSEEKERGFLNSSGFNATTRIISLKCYELKGNVRIYQDWGKIELDTSKDVWERRK